MKAVYEKKKNLRFSAVISDGFKGYPPMFHPHCEIIYVLNGQVDMMVDGYPKTLQKGETVFVFPYTVHRYESAPDAKLVVLLFDAPMTGIFKNELQSMKPAYPYVLQSESLQPLFERIARCRGGDALHQDKLAQAYLSAIVGELLNMMTLNKADAAAEGSVKQILLYCADHYTDEDISIKKIADALYISTSYVSKVFSGKLKIGFREYINFLRISHAKTLLVETDMKVLAIMLECGFRNQSTFNRIFSEVCGVSPRTYRKEGK